MLIQLVPHIPQIPVFSVFPQQGWILLGCCPRSPEAPPWPSLTLQTLETLNLASILKSDFLPPKLFRAPEDTDFSYIQFPPNFVFCTAALSTWMPKRNIFHTRFANPAILASDLYWETSSQGTADVPPLHKKQNRYCYVIVAVCRWNCLLKQTVEN